MSIQGFVSKFNVFMRKTLVVLAVFLLLPSYSFADDLNDDPVPYANDLGYFDGSYVFGQTASSNLYLPSVSSPLSSNETKYYSFAGEREVFAGYLTCEFESGHTYSGIISFSLPFTVMAGNYISDFRSGSVSFSSHQSLYGGSVEVFVVGNPSVTYSNLPYSGAFQVRYSFYNFTPNATSDYRFPLYIDVAGTGITSTYPGIFSYTLGFSSPSSYTCGLYDDVLISDGGSVQWFVDQQTTIIQEDNQAMMQQQESIANAQASQSAQQHEELVSGWDSSASDSMLQSKSDQLASYESQQDSAFNTGQEYVSDFASNYDTSNLNDLKSSFVLLSGWYTSIWNGMGNFSVILAVALVLCVAGYVLKLRK